MRGYNKNHGAFLTMCSVYGCSGAYSSLSSLPEVSRGQESATRWSSSRLKMKIHHCRRRTSRNERGNAGEWFWACGSLRWHQFSQVNLAEQTRRRGLTGTTTTHLFLVTPRCLRTIDEVAPHTAGDLLQEVAETRGVVDRVLRTPSSKQESRNMFQRNSPQAMPPGMRIQANRGVEEVEG